MRYTIIEQKKSAREREAPQGEMPQRKKERKTGTKTIDHQPHNGKHAKAPSLVRFMNVGAGDYFSLHFFHSIRSLIFAGEIIIIMWVTKTESE